MYGVIYEAGCEIWTGQVTDSEFCKSYSLVEPEILVGVSMLSTRHPTNTNILDELKLFDVDKINANSDKCYLLVNSLKNCQITVDNETVTKSKTEKLIEIKIEQNMQSHYVKKQPKNYTRLDSILNKI